MKLNLKDKKHLIVSGCSFTDGFWLADKGSWAYYLSDMLNVKLHNRARGGMGNEWICDSIISYLINNEHLIKDCVVGIAWSETTRLTNPIPLQDGEPREIDTVRPQDFLKDNSGQHVDGKYAKYNDAKEFFSDIPWCAYKTYMSIIKLKAFLELKNIPFLFIDAINPTILKFDNTKFTNTFNFTPNNNESSLTSLTFDLADYYHGLKDILNENVNSKIFNEFLQLGDSLSIQDYMWKNKGKEYDRLTLGNGGHPNDVASKEIAELIYKQII